MIKKYGQNFLINKNIINTIITEININKNSEILEIGPGDGALTKEIIKKNPKKFIAVEIDKNLKNNLEKYFNNYNHKLIIDNSLYFNEKKYFQDNYQIISNLPYNISLALLTKWIHEVEYKPYPSKMILMFQKEVAERILAKPNSKKYGRITVIASAFFKINKILNVDKKNFFPVPKVDSAILVFEKLKKGKIKFNEIKFLEQISFELFNNRRKYLKKKIKKLFSEKIIEKYSLNQFFFQRAENLSIDIFYKLAILLKKEKL